MNATRLHPDDLAALHAVNTGADIIATLVAGMRDTLKLIAEETPYISPDIVNACELATKLAADAGKILTQLLRDHCLPPAPTDAYLALDLGPGTCGELAAYVHLDRVAGRTAEGMRHVLKHIDACPAHCWQTQDPGAVDQLRDVHDARLAAEHGIL